MEGHWMLIQGDKLAHTLNIPRLELYFYLLRSPYGKTFPIIDNSTSYENGTVSCLCLVNIFF